MSQPITDSRHFRAAVVSVPGTWYTTTEQWFCFLVGYTHTVLVTAVHILERRLLRRAVVFECAFSQFVME